MNHHLLLGMALLIGCPKPPPQPPVPRPPPQPSAQDALLDEALERTAPGRLRGRFGFKIHSERLGLSGSTGGALIFDRPGRGHLAVLGPLGGPLLTLQTDGIGLAVAIQRDRQHLVVDDAGAQLQQQTGGVADLDAILGLLIGQLPLGGLQIEEREPLDDGDLRITFAGPQQTTVIVVIDDPAAVPVSLEARGEGDVLLVSATYGPFAPMTEGGDVLLPTEVSLQIPALDLQLDIQYKDRGWAVLTDVPDVFGLQPPEGFTSRPLDAWSLLELKPPGDPPG
ncbi:MAG TPA: hypothetical protein ENK18_28375 [Deltaproteobacteria bacterium]|nr:hypothetical protein [Deltaproteobacteria bacterium]